jgi:hypothetical protein
MGLDITAYENAELTDISVGDTDEHWDDWPSNWDFKAWVPSMAWKHKIKNFKENGLYKAEVGDSLGYSYGSHYQFRVILCEIMYRTEDDWRSGKLDPKMPFHELIDFSDCEGVLDYEICEKLYQDFIKYADRAKDYFEAKPTRYEDYYEQWTNCFNVARKNGAISFH